MRRVFYLQLQRPDVRQVDVTTHEDVHASCHPSLPGARVTAQQVIVIAIADR